MPESETRIEVLRNFRPRFVARSRYPSTSAADYIRQPAPDGGGCLANGGWIYVSDSENHLQSDSGLLSRELVPEEWILDHDRFRI